MKKIANLFILSLTLASFSALADEDQNFSLQLIKKPGYQHDQSVAIACKEINLSIKERASAFLKAQNGAMNEAQLNARAEYELKRNMHGRGNNMEYLHICTLKIRLTDDSKHIAATSSSTRIKGRGRISACEQMKAEIDQDIKVLFSEVDDSLLSCGVSPIISIQ